MKYAQAFDHDFRVFDIHQHAGSIDGYFGRQASSFSMSDDVAARLRYMDFWGVEQTLLMPASGYSQAAGRDATRKINDDLAEYCARNPERFPAAAGVVMPQDGDFAVEEQNRCIGQLGMKAMVWHHRFHGCPINHPGMHPLLEELERAQVPAMIHVIAESHLESPWRLEVLADAHRDVTFVALDAFSSPDQASWMQYIAQRHDNILFDTGVLTSAAHGLEQFVATVGAHRLLFGSDYYSSPRVFETLFPLCEILALDISDEDKAAVLGANARRLFGV